MENTRVEPAAGSVNPAADVANAGSARQRISLGVVNKTAVLLVRKVIKNRSEKRRKAPIPDTSLPKSLLLLVTPEREDLSL
ncbi:hypothetical protein [Dyadobacter sandarakinus]|uniref:Uncharacterized protein n=1 Tax=Dyadobacter sandarakinus TaxID=2747268 RepID=A0ABX7I2C0_9BACT|nr:hypothetical protein [Dyadobacter sandarakinus]QRR00214.1 hypothetical protein HWI92_04495 [Dyadobacter sandarakinus]